MEKQTFEIYLKKLGKKPHVVDGLTRQVVRFEQFQKARNQKLDSASLQDILDFAAELESKQTGSARKNIRGLALYFRFKGQPTLATAASNVREQEIAKKRQSFKLKDFMGVDAENIAKLKAIGITHAEHMLKVGKTSQSRKELADQTGLSGKAILELVKLSDLSRLDGVKAIRARLYFDAGVDTIEKLAASEPEALLRRTAEFVKRTGFDGIAPLPKEVLHTIEAARKLPKIVEYD